MRPIQIITSTAFIAKIMYPQYDYKPLARRIQANINLYLELKFNIIEPSTRSSKYYTWMYFGAMGIS